MNRAGTRQRSIPKNGEHFVEIAEADSAPRRSCDEMGSVAENRPAQIAGDSSIARAEIESLERLAAEKQHDGEQDQDQRNAERDPGGRSFSERKRAEPERASG